LGALAIVMLTVGSAGAQASKCTAAKFKEAGKKIGTKTKCHAKAVSKGLPVDPACIQKAEDKYASGWVKAEAKGDCVTGGDAEAIEAKVDALLADLNSSLGGPGPSRCTSKKIQAAGKKAAAKAKCLSKAAGKGIPVDPACLQKAEDKFTKAFTKAEASGDCVNATGDTAAIEARVDAFIADLVAELTPPPTTTSTTIVTTTTTSTTTTAPPFCGNGTPEAGEACDDGNGNTGDGCRPDCTQELCGDGILDPQEQCDDGGTTPGDGCNALCESEVNTCSPATAHRRVRVDINTPQALAGVRVDLEYPQAHTSIPGSGNSSLVRSRVQLFPVGGQNTVNDQETDLFVVLANATSFINSGPLFEINFDQCTALSENMCNRNQNVIGCCNNPADPNQFGDFCTKKECASMPGTACTGAPADCGSNPADCTVKIPCTSDVSCIGSGTPASPQFGLCVFKCPGNPPICPIGSFPTSGNGPCTSPAGGCPSENACITQTSNTLCTVSEPIDELAQPVAGVTCSVTITEEP
jgi:cysteine-rich repeat protein